MIAMQARHGLDELASLEPLLEPDAALALQRLLSQVELATRGATLSAKLLAKAVTARYARALELSLTEPSTPAWSRFVWAVHELTTDLERNANSDDRQSADARIALRRIVMENADLLIPASYVG
jgi:hypothetical protein